MCLFSLKNHSKEIRLFAILSIETRVFMVFLLFFLTCIAVNMTGNAQTKVIHANRNTQLLYGESPFVVTQQGILRVKKVSISNGKMYFMVHWHQNPGAFDMLFWCDMCRKGCMNREEFVAHANNFHGLLLYRNSSKWIWYQSRSAMTGDLKYVCEHCMQTFETEMLFHHHIVTVHHEIPYAYG